jgi:hypothetical protein
MFRFPVCYFRLRQLNFHMKNIRLIVFLFLAFLFSAEGADTLRIAPCDAAVFNGFGELITLSRNTGTLQRYRGDKLLGRYQGSGSGNKIFLQEPLYPVTDDPDRIYLLDASQNTIIGWDRFLNLHSIIPLDGGIVSPADFTINSEHEWLIYDAFRQEIFQVYPGERFFQRWGDRSLSSAIRMHRDNANIIIHLRDRGRLRVCDRNGNTLDEFALPDSLAVSECFPLQRGRYALLCGKGVYVWDPLAGSCRFLSGLEDVIYVHAGEKHFTLINRKGMVITVP